MSDKEQVKRQGPLHKSNSRTGNKEDSPVGGTPNSSMKSQHLPENKRTE
jgi:hypothetical protein